MFFKNRTERDIDNFKAMQNAGSRLVRRTEHSDQQDVLLNTSSAGQRAQQLDDEIIDRIFQELADGAKDPRYSVVSINATWDGKLRTEGSARLEGTISGEVEAGDTILIAKGARVRANIRARRVIIGGDMEGQVICHEQLVVQQSGRLGGKAGTKTLVIEEGAVVHSQIQMLPGTAPAQAIGKDTNTAQRQDPVAIEALQTELRQGRAASPVYIKK